MRHLCDYRPCPPTQDATCRTLAVLFAIATPHFKRSFEQTTNILRNKRMYVGFMRVEGSACVQLRGADVSTLDGMSIF